MRDPVPYLKQGDNIVMVVDGTQYTMNAETHMNYAKLVEALKAQDWDVVVKLVDIKKSLEDYSQGLISIKDGEVLYDEETFHNALADRLIDMYAEGFPIDPMLAFIENLMENPSKTSVDEFYLFMENNSLPITPDGYFLAYKKVHEDYTDIYTSKISNQVGQKPTMRRNKVDDKRHNTCSEGFHFCSLEYLPHFGSSQRNTDKVMILKINPRDVVSIPSDYNNAKGRCCVYEVIGEYGIAGEVQHEEAFDKSVVDPSADEKPTQDFGNGI